MEKEKALGHYCGQKAYALIDGKLEEVKLIRTNYELYEDEHAYADETIVQRPNGELHTMGQIEFEPLYSSPEAYEYSARMSTSCFNMTDPYVINKLFKRNNGHDGKKYYTFSGGEAHEHTLSLANLTYDYATEQLSLSGDSAIPDSVETYRSRQEAYNFNTYKVVDENGVESERVGCNRLLFLDDDQKALVKQFEALVTKMENSGIYMVMDCCENIQAFNIRKVKDYAMAYDINEMPTDDGRVWEECKRYAEQNRVGVTIADWSEDNTIFINRKSGEE